MVGAAMAALKEVEAILFVVEAPEPPGPGDRYVAESLGRVRTPVILVVNKADLCSGDVTRANVESYLKLGEFAAHLAISAVRDESFELLLRTIESFLPEGPRYYPEGVDTDQPEAFIIAELIREKVLETTRDEVPHSVAVVVEELRPGGRRAKETGERAEEATGDRVGDVPRNRAADVPAGLLYARAVIYVERESQKGIIVGSGGTMLRDVGLKARREIEALFGTKVYLDLWVKVEKNWRDRAGALRALGYTSPRE